MYKPRNKLVFISLLSITQQSEFFGWCFFLHIHYACNNFIFFQSRSQRLGFFCSAPSITNLFKCSVQTDATLWPTCNSQQCCVLFARELYTYRLLDRPIKFANSCAQFRARMNVCRHDQRILQSRRFNIY